MGNYAACREKRGEEGRGMGWGGVGRGGRKTVQALRGVVGGRDGRGGGSDNISVTTTP